MNKHSFKRTTIFVLLCIIGVQLILIGVKLGNVINLNWILVFSPIILSMIVFVGLLVYCLLAISSYADEQAVKMQELERKEEE